MLGVGTTYAVDNALYNVYKKYLKESLVQIISAGVDFTRSDDESIR